MRRLPKHHWSYGPYFDVDASKVAADGTVTNRRRQFGVMTLSRWPILSSRLHILPKFKTGAIFFHLASPLGVDPYGDGGILFHQACAVWLSSVVILLIRRRRAVALVAHYLPFVPIPAKLRIQ